MVEQLAQEFEARVETQRVMVYDGPPKVEPQAGKGQVPELDIAAEAIERFGK